MACVRYLITTVNNLGGWSDLMRGAGRDATKLFNEMHEYVNFEYLLNSCKVGKLVTKRTLEKISADPTALLETSGKGPSI